MAEKAELKDREHPLYEDNLQLWELYEDSAKGGDNFINTNNLFTHRLEDSEDYEERLDRAYYLNFCDSIPNLYNAFIFKEKVERPPNEDLDMFRQNTDNKFRDIADFIRKCGYLSKIYGSIHVLLDMPTAPDGVKLSKAMAKKLNLYPYATIVRPTELKDWSVDSNGLLNWIVIESTHYIDADPNKEREEQKIFKLITREEWSYVDEDGKSVKFEDGKENKGPNDLGEIPLITLFHESMDDSIVGESLLKDIVYINRIIMNWCSCLDEQIERQTFSQLIVPDDGSLAEESESGDDPLRSISTTSVWTFNADSIHPPSFISPDTDNLTTIWKLVVDHIKEIYRLSGLIGSSDDMYVTTSGRAAQMGFLGVNSALAETSKRYEKFENEVSKLALRMLNKNEEEYEDVKYPDSFDISALNDEIDAQISVMERNFSPELNKTMQKNIARKATPLAPLSIRETIDTEIESGSGEVIPLEILSIQANAELGGEGNPNSNVGKTFRTKDQKETEETTHRREE